MVGDKTFTTYVDNLKQLSYKRVVYNNDEVAYAPLNCGLDYSHAGDESAKVDNGITICSTVRNSVYSACVRAKFSSIPLNCAAAGLWCYNKYDIHTSYFPSNLHGTCAKDLKQ